MDGMLSEFAIGLRYAERYLCGMNYRVGIAAWFEISMGLVVLAAFVGCKGSSETPVGDVFKIEKALYAEGFQWRQWKDAEEEYTCLEIRNPMDSSLMAMVYRDSATWASDRMQGENRVVLGPSDRGLATLSTTHLALISSWDSLCMHWSGGAYMEFIRWKPALEKWARMEAYDIGGKPEIDREKLLALRPSALTIYPFGDPIGGMDLKKDIPVVPILEYLESHPLGRAEWMRVMGWMMGEESAHQSDERFQQVSVAYERMRSDLAEKKDKPRVFTGSVQQGTWHAPGPQSFIARLLVDAGLDYIVDSASDRDNVELPLEEMIVLSQTADAWGLVLHHPGTITRSILLDADDRNAMLLPPSNDVFVANTADCDYFGQWVARPDLMLENLVLLFDDRFVWRHPVEPCFQWISE